MRIEEYTKFDAIGLAELVARDEVTPTELLNCALEMIAKTNQTVNAIASHDQSIARKKLSNLNPGVFRGVPFLVKELLPYPGLVTAMGSRLFAQYKPPVGSEYTQRIDESGLVTFGNTTSSEFGLLGSTETLLHGMTHNPWNQAYSAAGSSGGSAAAVASGIVPMAHANDGGGSIRVPAAVCGLFGFKPSAGRCVSTMEQSGPFHDLISDHCVSKSVRDSAAFLSVTEQKGPDAKFAPIGFVHEGLKRKLRIGVYTRTLLGREAEAEVLESIRKTVQLCRDLGHDAMENPGPQIDGAAVSTAFFTLAGSVIDQMIKFMEPMLGRKVNDNDLEPFTYSLVAWFQSLGSDALEKAMQDMNKASMQMLGYMENCDILLCPTLAATPKKLEFLSPKLDRELLIHRTEEYVGYTPIHNISGMCAMSMPLFADRNGMPLGSHFAAKPGAEALLFKLAYDLESARPWCARLPV